MISFFNRGKEFKVEILLPEEKTGMAGPRGVMAANGSIPCFKFQKLLGDGNNFNCGQPRSGTDVVEVDMNVISSISLLNMVEAC